ncbi:MAG: D-alanyl-D-alanine carboxypeptidase/D-alanyl-D-alanine-endopeptidase [Myxococcota bacterium]
MILAFALSAHAAKLERVVEDLLDDAALDGASVGLVVTDAEGRERVAIDPQRRLIPASTAKWVTAAAAAHELGLDYRFETTVAATGWTEGDTLHGDLVVVGAGDLSLGDPDPQQVAADLAALLRQLEVTRIEGDLVVDASHFDGPSHGPGWMWDDLGYAFSAPYTAANVAHNLAVAGVACPAQNGPGSPLVDPPACLAALLLEGLPPAGVEVTGTAAVRAVPEAVPIGVLRSAPLRELLARMLATSDNLYAECIARALDRRPVADAAEARARVDDVLQAAGIPRERLSLVDGSGLSRYSLASAAAMVRLTRWADTQPWGPELEALLPVAGQQGTLAARMTATPAEGHVRAKTGSMTGVRNLVGWVDTSGGPAAFAFLINGVAVPQQEVIALQDRVMAVIAASDGRRVKRKVAAALAEGSG